MDWNELEERAVEALSEYLRIDTSNPPGNEAEGASFLASLLREEGLEPRLFETAPGRVSLLARLPGDGTRKPLILLNHIDVVPADERKWQVHPFSGEIADGFVWGRGALDMKGMGIMELFAFIAAARREKTLSRDLVFLATADEETGGDLGAAALLENHPGELEAGVVINEGGYATLDLVPGKTLFMIACAEKYGLWLRLKRRGLGGHGSVPTGQGALDLMVPALARLLQHRRPLRPNAVMQAFFHVLAAHLEFLEAYREKKDPAVLLKLLEESGLTELPVLNAVLRDTVSLTMFHAGSKINVIPDEAEAQLDCRLLPETEEDEFLDFLRRALDDPGMEIERVKHMGKAPSSPFDGDIYGAIEKAVGEEYPGSLAAPFMLSGLSDSRFFRARGVPCYGIIPARLSLADLPRIHGVDERISVEDVKRGVRFIHAVVTGICS